MLEKITKMVEQLQPSDFFENNNNVEAAIFVIAKGEKVTIVGGGNAFLQAQAIAKIIQNSNPLFRMALMVAMEEK